MKTLITSLFAILIFCQTGFAIVRTISNHPAGGAQFSTLQAGYDASAVTGDTLSLEGTGVIYFLNPGVRWEKSIVVLGIGINPQKQIPKRVKFGQYTFTFRPGASGSRFYGIDFVNRAELELGVGAINNLGFEDCLFFDFYANNGTSSNGLTFTNCVFDSDNATNIFFGNGAYIGTFTSCIFDGFIEGTSNPNLTLEFNHCLYLSTAGTQIFNNVYYAIIRNSIFMNRFPTGTFSSSYLNNLCRVAGTFPPSPSNGNTASGNTELTDPLFVNNPVNTLYNKSLDYHLQVGSAAIGSANDGTDMGPHGGYSLFSESLETLIIPIIRTMSILNTSVESNGTLNVQLQITTPNSN